jgi:cytochrome bd-type quinol oxidase subunit 1
MYFIGNEPIFEMPANFLDFALRSEFRDGVATGIVKQFQFGTNWASYSRGCEPEKPDGINHNGLRLQRP